MKGATRTGFDSTCLGPWQYGSEGTDLEVGMGNVDRQTNIPQIDIAFLQRVQVLNNRYSILLSNGFLVFRVPMIKMCFVRNRSRC